MFYTEAQKQDYYTSLIHSKASYKMRKAIERIEKKYGRFDKTYDIEFLPECRARKGFFDLCTMSDAVTGRHFQVTHTGEILHW